MISTTATTSPRRGARVRPGYDRRVVVEQPLDDRGRIVRDDAEALEERGPVLGQRFGPGVEDDPAGDGGRDDGRGDDGGDPVGGDRAEDELLAIAEEACAGPDLGDLAGCSKDAGRRRAGADPLDREAVGPQRTAAPRTATSSAAADRPGAGRAVAVAAVGEDADDLQPRVAGRARDRDPASAGPATPLRRALRVESTRTRSGPGPTRDYAGEQPRRLCRVHPDRKRSSAVQPSEALG